MSIPIIQHSQTGIRIPSVDPYTDQTGAGFDAADAFKLAVTNIDKTKKTIGLLGDIWGSEIATQLKNYYGREINQNPNWRPGFAGEKHMINTSGTSMNWCGPGTKVLERLTRGDPGVDEYDEICKNHDIEYSSAVSARDIRKADKRMLAALRKKPSGAMKTMLQGAIKAKTLAEDTGLLQPGTFGNIPTGLTKEEKRALKKSRKKQIKKALSSHEEEILQKLKKMKGNPAASLSKSIKNNHYSNFIYWLNNFIPF